MPFTGYHAPGNLDEGIDHRGHSFHYHTNNYGFLSKYDVQAFAESNYQKPPDERVVLLTGGSGAWGFGASSNEKTAAYVLEDLLNVAEPTHRWKVVNLAMLAFASYQEFIALDMFGRGLHPDWIVLLDGRNDIRNFTTLSTTVT